jgi:hypothetical protein
VVNDVISTNSSFNWLKYEANHIYDLRDLKLKTLGNFKEGKFYVNLNKDFSSS